MLCTGLAAAHLSLVPPAARGDSGHHELAPFASFLAVAGHAGTPPTTCCAGAAQPAWQAEPAVLAGLESGHRPGCAAAAGGARRTAAAASHRGSYLADMRGLPAGYFSGARRCALDDQRPGSAARQCRRPGQCPAVRAAPAHRLYESPLTCWSGLLCSRRYRLAGLRPCAHAPDGPHS